MTCYYIEKDKEGHYPEFFIGKTVIDDREYSTVYVLGSGVEFRGSRAELAEYYQKIADELRTRGSSGSNFHRL